MYNTQPRTHTLTQKRSYSQVERLASQRVRVRDRDRDRDRDRVLPQATVSSAGSGSAPAAAGSAAAGKVGLGGAGAGPGAAGGTVLAKKDVVKRKTNGFVLSGKSAGVAGEAAGGKKEGQEQADIRKSTLCRHSTGHMLQQENTFYDDQTHSTVRERTL